MRTLALLLAAVLLAPALAAAQEAAPTLQEDPRAARFQDVERGFFVGFEAGYLGLLRPQAALTSSLVEFRYSRQAFPFSHHSHNLGWG